MYTDLLKAITIGFNLDLYYILWRRILWRLWHSCSHFQGVATITRINIIRSVSNFGNRKVPRKYRSSSNMNKIGQPKLGYLPLNFFNLSHYRGVATITQTNIRSVSNFGNKKVPRKYRSSSNMSEIGQPELGYLPLNSLNFFHVRGVATIT